MCSTWVGVPDGPEDAVGEAHPEEVLHRRESEEVIDAERSSIADAAAELGEQSVELDRAGEVLAERLFHDDPAAQGEADGAERPHGRGKQARRQREVDGHGDVRVATCSVGDHGPNAASVGDVDLPITCRLGERVAAGGRDLGRVTGELLGDHSPEGLIVHLGSSCSEEPERIGKVPGGV